MGRSVGLRGMGRSYMYVVKVEYFDLWDGCGGSVVLMLTQISSPVSHPSDSSVYIYKYTANHRFECRAVYQRFK